MSSLRTLTPSPISPSKSVQFLSYGALPNRVANNRKAKKWVPLRGPHLVLKNNSKDVTKDATDFFPTPHSLSDMEAICHSIATVHPPSSSNASHQHSNASPLFDYKTSTISPLYQANRPKFVNAKDDIIPSNTSKQSIKDYKEPPTNATATATTSTSSLRS
ncbi:hypothetical protein L1887_12018 [Cichorium endivia]|nr:hypothetical protein L1887_12018 [Cichorium endivia]